MDRKASKKINQEIKRLIKEQMKDKGSSVIFHHIINPVRRSKPYREIKDVEERAVFILWKFCNYSERQLGTIFKRSRKKISAMLAKILDDLDC